MDGSLSDRVVGCLVGGAVGDALGAPVEGWSHERIRSEYGKVDDFEPYSLPFSDGAPGSVTDDTTLRQHIASAIIEHEGRITVDEYATHLVQNLDEGRVWVPEEITLKKLLAGVEPANAGAGNIPTATITAAITPVGIVNAGDPSRAYQDAYNIASVHQHGLEQGAAATVAAGVAAALAADSTIDGVLETMQTEAPDLLTRGIDLAITLADESDSVDAFVDRFYDEMLDWRWSPVEWNKDHYEAGELFSASSLEILPATVGILVFCGDDTHRALVEAASFGRDSDTIASLVGSVCGAVHGASSVPDSWVETVERANSDLFIGSSAPDDGGFEWVSDRFIDALERERERAANRASQIDDLLDE